MKILEQPKRIHLCRRVYKGSLGDSVLLRQFPVRDVYFPCFLAQPQVKKCPTSPPGHQIWGHNCARLQRVSQFSLCKSKFAVMLKQTYRILTFQCSPCFLSFFLLLQNVYHQGSTAYTCNFYLYIKLLPLLGVANFLVSNPEQCVRQLSNPV